MTEGRVLGDATVGTVTFAVKQIRRLGFGAMRVSGARNAEGVRDRDEAVRMYRRVYDRGVNFIDVANVYGLGECEEILAEALHPYPDDLVIATKAGFRPGKIDHGVSAAQVACAWLLQRSPVMVPIPGTSQVAHADDNVDSAWLDLSADELARLDASGETPVRSPDRPGPRPDRP